MNIGFFHFPVRTPNTQSAKPKLAWLIVLICLSFPVCSQAQGTLKMTFEGQPSGTAYFVQQYFESGMWFRPLGILGPGNGFGRNGGGVLAGFPDDGSAYLQASAGDSLMFSFLNGSPFSLNSVDLAEFSTLYNYPATIQLIGYRSDGSTVAANLTTDGIIDGNGPLADFETFSFGPEFSDLKRVEIPSYGWCLDNLVVSVPEPSAASLMLLGSLLFYKRLRKS
jgi:hypothetical protein